MSNKLEEGREKNALMIDQKIGFLFLVINLGGPKGYFWRKGHM